MYEIETKLRSYSSLREVQHVNNITKYSMTIVGIKCWYSLQNVLEYIIKLKIHVLLEKNYNNLKLKTIKNLCKN